jgi:hypothetical protein
VIASKYLSTFSGFAIITLFSENVEFLRNYLLEMMKLKEIARERKITNICGNP